MLQKSVPRAIPSLEVFGDAHLVVIWHMTYKKGSDWGVIKPAPPTKWIRSSYLHKNTIKYCTVSNTPETNGPNSAVSTTPTKYHLGYLSVLPHATVATYQKQHHLD